MRTLQISLECEESDNIEQNFTLWRHIFQGVTPDPYTLHGLSPFSTLILYLYQTPLKRRAYGATVLSWYGYLLGLIPPDERMVEVLALFEKYVNPHSSDPKHYVQRALGIWQVLLEETEPDIGLDKNQPPTFRADSIPESIPHSHVWCVIQGADRSFIWRRSAFIENPLLMDLLREVQDRYGVLPIWSKHSEGEYILIPPT